MLASSPYAKTAVLWETYCKQYGPTGEALTLVAHGASKVFNPTLPQRVIDRALEKDRAKATAEYLAEFRTDLEGFVTLRARVRRGGRSPPSLFTLLECHCLGSTTLPRAIRRAIHRGAYRLYAATVSESRFGATRPIASTIAQAVLKGSARALHF
jgi:hypothetical protein